MAENTVTAYISLGSNKGDRHAFLTSAVRMLAENGFTLTRFSSIYETAPVECAADAPSFLNAVIEGEWTGTATTLVAMALRVEQQLGRQRSVERNAPREIDIDVLLCGEETCATPDVHVPHPRMHTRLFVLAPLCELAGERRHAPTGETYAALRDRCRASEASKVRLCAPPHALTQSSFCR